MLPFPLSLLLVALPHPAPPAAAGGDGFDLVVTNNLFSDDVSVLSVSSGTEVARIPVGTRPNQVAMSGDGQYAYVGLDSNGSAPLEVKKIDLGTLAVVDSASIPSQSHMSELEVSPDGKWLVVAEYAQATVHLVDTATMGVVWTQVLCVECDGFGGPLFAGVTSHFTGDSQHLYVGVRQRQEFNVLHVPTGTLRGVLEGQAGGSAAYADLALLPGFDERPFLPGSSINVRVYNVPNGTFHDLPVGNSLADLEMAPEVLMVGASSIVLDGAPDFVQVIDLQAASIMSIPTAAETFRNLRYSALTNEFWCKDGGYSVVDLTAGNGVLFPAGATFFGTRADLTADGATYCFPETAEDQVLLVDVATRTPLGEVNVGTNPRGVYAQGDSSPTEQ